MQNETTMPCLNELADMIACKRLLAPKEIEIDIDMLRRLTVRPTQGERRFFGSFGLTFMAYGEITDGILFLVSGILMLTIPILGVLYEQRSERVKNWFEKVRNVRA